MPVCWVDLGVIRTSIVFSSPNAQQLSISSFSYPDTRGSRPDTVEHVEHYQVIGTFGVQADDIPPVVTAKLLCLPILRTPRAGKE
jgi:hypothetical protein